MLHIAFNNDFTQAVHETTRIGPTTNSILDLVFVYRKIEGYAVTVHEGLSYHKVVLLCIKKYILPSHVKRNRIMVKDFSQADDVSVLDHKKISLNSFHVGINVK